MYTKQPKKMIIINILDILKRYTDENHRLSQREIMDILEREYDMKVDRKAVKRNLMNLIDFGYQVEYSESIRQGKNGEEEIIFTDWYLEKEIPICLFHKIHFIRLQTCWRRTAFYAVCGRQVHKG